MTKPTKWVCAQRRLRSAWHPPSLIMVFAVHMNLATHWAHSEDSDQTGRMRTLILLVLSCRGSYIVPWFTVSPDMEIYRGDYWFACFRVCSHSVLDKINNENRQARCIVYGQQVQINYRSIFSGVKSIIRKRNFHICKHVGQHICCYLSRLFTGYLLLYHNISIADLSPLGFLALECEKRKAAQCDIWLHFCLSLVLNWLNFCSVGPSRQ